MREIQVVTQAIYWEHILEMEITLTFTNGMKPQTQILLDTSSEVPWRTEQL